MKNPQRMQLLEAFNYLNKQIPYHLLSHELILLFVLFDLEPQVLIIGQLHYYAL